MIDDTPEVARSVDSSVRSVRLEVPAHCHLLVFTGTSSSMFQLPPEGSVVIGRAETADLQIEDALVSRAHARLSIADHSITIEDLGSHAGTYVNRERIMQPCTLAPGDTIAINKTTLIVHATHPSSAPSVLLESSAFRHRVEAELERAVRYERNFTVVVMLWDDTSRDRNRIERILERQLRRIDAASWSDATSMHILLAEAEAAEATAFVTRLRGHLDTSSVRIGHASCPADGADVDALLACARTAAAGSSLGEISTAVRTHQTLTIGSQRVLIADPSVVRLYALIERLAPIDLPVLVTGETGCGKELAAKAIHMQSPRRARPLVSLNCAAIQETLVESELFGHERGAFSGAVTAKQGLLEAAQGSTLFLDEIGELALTTQAKLLRVLETRRFTRVGDVKEREVDVRIVAATNRVLEDEVAAGRFRQDLYFRLSGATLHLPPLRQRPRELGVLATAFLDEACTRVGRRPMRIGTAALEALRAHSWPGNVRELKNLMHYVAAAYPDELELGVEHVADRIAPRKGSGAALGFRPLADDVRELEIQRILAALEHTGGNQTRAAILLSVPKRTFFEKMKQYGLRKPGDS